MDERIFKLLSLPNKCLFCNERDLAVKSTCSFKCEPEPIDLIDIVEEIAQ